MKKLPIHTNIFFLIIISTVLAPLLAQAQTGQDKYVTIDSRPSGAVVHLEGEYQFIGRTPFVVPYTIIGKYQVKTDKLGYQKLRRTITFSGNSATEIQLRLIPKNRFKAVGRSTVVPGWGQFYSDRKFSGVLYSSLTAVGAISLIKIQQDYTIASRKYESALGKSQTGGYSYDDRLQLLIDVDQAWENYQQKKDRRRANMIILAGIWAINIVDSFFFFPNYSQDIEVFEKFSFNAMPLNDGLGLSLNYNLD